MANPDETLTPHWKQVQAMNQAKREADHPLQHGGGGGTYDGMESRVTRLEVTMEHIREDMTEAKADLKAIIGLLGKMPTKADLWAWKWQWTAIGFATMAIVIGGIIGGLSWIQPDPAPPAPIVVTIPR